MRRIAVTGSASGIGAATREQLEREGASVVGIDLRDAEIVADLSVGEGRTSAIRAVLDRVAGELDGLVACAGLGPVPGPAPLIASVNYFGTVELLDGLKDALTRGSDPAVVAVCSNSATTVPDLPSDLVQAMLDDDEGSARWLAESTDPSIVYAASKLALGRALRRRAPVWAEAGVRLNGVAPGAVRTPLLQEGLDDADVGPMIRQFPIPLGGFGRPEQVAASIAFLLGEGSSFCCGSILFVDGGSDALIRPDSF